MDDGHLTPATPSLPDGIAAAPQRPGLGRAAPVALIGTVWPILGSVTTALAAPLLAPWLRTQGPAGVAYFVAAVALLGAVAFAPTYATAVVAGWTFGFRIGFPAMLAGTLVGATLCHATARCVAAERVASTFRVNPKWEVVRRALVEANLLKTLWLVMLLRLSPVLPFGTTNILLSTTGVRLPVYVLGTLIGLAPRTGVVTLAAAGAERLDLTAAQSWPLLISGVVATALCIVMFAVFGKRALDRATRKPLPPA